MCGISGIVGAEHNEETLARLKKMTDSLAHRGPDGEGHWVSSDQRTALGHRRLSIIDLSVEAGQPMHYLDRYTIVFNGEIYNYIELRESLLKEGYRFRTSGDTEVIMALYHRDRENCLRHLDGQFALAIYDEAEKTLFCARDRFGEKPFHYHYEPGKKFIFGSEMKAIWAAGVEKKVNSRMLYNYLKHGFEANPADHAETFFSNITRLEHAHYLIVDTRTLCISIHKYWDIDPAQQHSTLGIGEACEKFRELFLTSVHRRLRSDVPVGSSLSGGLDSSLVVCAIDQLNADRHFVQKTFSARFPGFAKDESRFQQIVIDRTNAQGYFTIPDEQVMLNEIDKVFYHQEEPFGSASILAQYEVFRLAKQHAVTVLLDGQGADEFLAGYHFYYRHFFSGLLKDNVAHDREWKAYLALHGSNAINGVLENDFRYRLRSSLPFVFNTMKSLKKQFINDRGNFSKDFHVHNRSREFDFASDQVFLNRALRQSTLGGSLQTLLRYCDRNSMAHSREVRLPFLFHELVEFVFSLPDTYKMHNGWTKYLMREASKNILPEEICWRVEKVGYEPPQKKWMQSAMVKDIVHHNKEILVNNGILDPAVLSHKVEGNDALVKGDNSWNMWMAGKLVGA